MIQKIQLGRWTIRTSSSLKKILLDTKCKAEKGSFNKTYWKLVGIYDTRFLGLVFYRNSIKYREQFNY